MSQGQRECEHYIEFIEKLIDSGVLSDGQKQLAENLLVYISGKVSRPVDHISQAGEKVETCGIGTDGSETYGCPHCGIPIRKQEPKPKEKTFLVSACCHTSVGVKIPSYGTTGQYYHCLACNRPCDTVDLMSEKRIEPLKGNWVNDEGKLRKMEDKMQEIIHAMNLIREDTDRILAGNAHNERKT